MFTALFWKKIWTWLKHYWYWPVIAILFVLSTPINAASTREKLFDLLFKQREGYEKELQIINTNNKEKDLKKHQATEEHKQELEKIEQEHDIKIEELEDAKREELTVTIEQNKDKPEKLAEEIAKILSAEFHKNSR
mgnify:CR=1 FL=1|tara:strand:+ start:8844 stop:9251 length:408 start_codon:yes stop_codon:yes gene_type:complete